MLADVVIEYVFSLLLLSPERVLSVVLVKKVSHYRVMCPLLSANNVAGRFAEVSLLLQRGA